MKKEMMKENIWCIFSYLGLCSVVSINDNLMGDSCYFYM